jgi:hypothetical protein
MTSIDVPPNGAFRVPAIVPANGRSLTSRRAAANHNKQLYPTIDLRCIYSQSAAKTLLLVEEIKGGLRHSPETAQVCTTILSILRS